MTNKDLDALYKLLDKLMQVAPCKGGACRGYQNCEFIQNGCYGESCAIEDVQNALYSVVKNCENETSLD